MKVRELISLHPTALMSGLSESKHFIWAVPFLQVSDLANP